jgi:hypothetical protein
MKKKLFDFDLGLKKMNGLEIAQFSQKHFVTIFKHMHTIKLGMLELLDLHLMLPKPLQKKALMKLNRYQWDIATCLFT